MLIDHSIAVNKLRLLFFAKVNALRYKYLKWNWTQNAWFYCHKPTTRIYLRANILSVKIYEPNVIHILCHSLQTIFFYRTTDDVIELLKTSIPLTSFLTKIWTKLFLKSTHLLQFCTFRVGLIASVVRANCLGQNPPKIATSQLPLLGFSWNCRFSAPAGRSESCDKYSSSYLEWTDVRLY